MKKYRRAIALFLAIGLMVLIPSGMGVSASGNTVEAKMSENIAQVLSMTGIERRGSNCAQWTRMDNGTR